MQSRRHVRVQLDALRCFQLVIPGVVQAGSGRRRSRDDLVDVSPVRRDDRSYRRSTRGPAQPSMSRRAHRRRERRPADFAPARTQRADEFADLLLQAVPIVVLVIVSELMEWLSRQDPRSPVRIMGISRSGDSVMESEVNLGTGQGPSEDVDEVLISWVHTPQAEALYEQRQTRP